MVRVAAPPPHMARGQSLQRPHCPTRTSSGSLVWGAARATPWQPVAAHLPRAAAGPDVLIETGSPVRPYVSDGGAVR